ncbi:hypothetical protein BHM03_00007525 [Ensete ventricosum]|nr:hypothetical protein BHM03_00007525 [Ensete ventricosum]
MLLSSPPSLSLGLRRRHQAFSSPSFAAAHRRHCCRLPPSLLLLSRAVVIYEMCIEEPTATVKNVKHQEKLKYPPYPLSTVELQKRASRFFRMSSEHTMKIAEELYQAGFISYPRTETDGFSVNMDLHVGI